MNPEAARPDGSRSWPSRSAEETERLGEKLAATLEEGDVLALTGPLGAGKTRLVAGIARGLGWNGDVRSPTFTLINEYPGRRMLVHVDLYRVETLDTHSLGLEEYLDRAILVIEWGEKLPTSFLEGALRLEIEPSSETERLLVAHGEGGARAQEWLRACERALAVERARGEGGEERSDERRVRDLRA